MDPQELLATAGRALAVYVLMLIAVRVLVVSLRLQLRREKHLWKISELPG